jgi:hypothetical protein
MPQAPRRGPQARDQAAQATGASGTEHEKGGHIAAPALLAVSVPHPMVMLAQTVTCLPLRRIPAAARLAERKAPLVAGGGDHGSVAPSLQGWCSVRPG